jgi:hypothetical protein
VRILGQVVVDALNLQVIQLGPRQSVEDGWMALRGDQVAECRANQLFGLFARVNHHLEMGTNPTVCEIGGRAIHRKNHVPRVAVPADVVDRIRQGWPRANQNGNAVVRPFALDPAPFNLVGARRIDLDVPVQVLIRRIADDVNRQQQRHGRAGIPMLDL